jgi:hypothetical protein
VNRSGLPLSLLLALAGCDDRPLVLVDADALPRDLDAVLVRSLLDGRPAAETLRFGGGERRFGLRLPREAAGRVSVQVEGLAGGCVTARAEGAADLVAGARRAEVVLSGGALSAPLCACGGDLQHFCSEQPRAAGHTLHRVFGLGLSTWAVGARGTVRHLRDGVPLPDDPVQRTGTDADLHDLWGPAPDRLWAVGERGTVLRFDGIAWQRVEVPEAAQGVTLYGVWGRGPDVWIVGQRRTVLRLRDGAFIAAPREFPDAAGAAETLYSVWGDGADVWVGGGVVDRPAGRVYRLAGARWEIQATARYPIHQVRGDGGEFLAVGGGMSSDGGTPTGVLLRQEGATLVDRASAGMPILHGLDGKKGAWVLVGGDLRNGSGVAYRWDGSRATQVQLPPGSNTPLRGVWAQGDRPLFVGEFGLVLQVRGEETVTLSEAQPEHHVVTGLWAAGPDDVWAVGEITGRGGIILRHRGGSWAPVLRTPRPLHGVWGSGPEDIWFVGGAGTVLRYDGRMIRAQGVAGVSGDVRAVWGSGPRDVWAVGDKGLVLRDDGGGFKRDTSIGLSTGASLYAVWGSGPDDVWIGGGMDGGNGLLLRWHEEDWTLSQIESRTPPWIVGIWGSGPEQVFAVGSDYGAAEGSIFKWDRERRVWMSQVSPLYGVDRFKGIWGSGPGDVWAVGGRSSSRWISGGAARSAIYHHDGVRWSEVRAPTSNNLECVFGVDPLRVWIGGHGGAILRTAL